MQLSRTDLAIDSFTLALLRGSYALTELGAEAAEALSRRSDSEDGAQAAYALITESVHAALERESASAIDSATRVLSAAVDRVLDHLDLVLDDPEWAEGADRVAEDPAED